MQHPFEYQPPTEEQIRVIQEFRYKMRELHDAIVDQIPSSRARSLAITQLEQCSMWVNKAIVFATSETEI